MAIRTTRPATIQPASLEALDAILTRWDKAGLYWRGLDHTNASESDRAKFELVLIGSELAGYLKGTLGPAE
jgi:hypothetical protein